MHSNIMIFLHAALVLSLCSFLPSSTLAEPHPPQSVEVFWRWDDKGNSNPSDHTIFTGKATVTWTRSAGCKKRTRYETLHPYITATPVTVTAVTINNSKDFMDPASVYHWGHARDSAIIQCDAYSRTDFWVHNADRTRKMKIRLPDICTDADCPGPEKQFPNIDCLNGPKGRVVMYRDKWINECKDPWSWVLHLYIFFVTSQRTRKGLYVCLFAFPNAVLSLWRALMDNCVIPCISLFIISILANAKSRAYV